MSFNREYYKDYISYKDFLSSNADKIQNLDLIKTNIVDINNRCRNKDFIFILLFEKWISYSNTVKIFKQKSENEPSNYINDVNTNFENFDLYPFYKDKDKDSYLNILPLININPIIDILNNLNEDYGVKNKKLDELYSKIEQLLPRNASKSKIERINDYNDTNYEKIDETNGGLFYNLLELFEKDKGKYLLKYNKYLESKAQFQGKEFIKILTDKIDTIKSKDFSSINNLLDVIKLNSQIIGITKKIIDFFNYIMLTVTSLKRNLDKDETNLTVDITLRKDFVTSFYTIDQLIEAIGTNVQPSFKKSYVVKENNLSPFIKLKILNYAKNKEDYVEINNFNIPYNNILSLEHNVIDRKITVTLIDTEGDLSNLLIYKMYQVSTGDQNIPQASNNNVIVNPDQPYVFEIEYGWSGPESENEEELLENKVFTKKNFRGYIRSINSQFNLNGTEYTLDITPNDNEAINTHMNYYDFFYKSRTEVTENSSFFINLIILYFILKYGRKNINKLLREKTTPDNDRVPALQLLFDTIDNVRSEGVVIKYKETGTRTNPNTTAFLIIQKIKQIIGPNDKTDDVTFEYTEEINKATKDELKDFLLIEKFISSIRPNIYDLKNENNKPSYIRYVDLSKIKVENVHNIFMDISNEFRLNAWICAIYLIYKLKYFFRGRNDDVFVLHDTTSLFDVFDDNNQYIDKNKFYKIINDFNIFCFDEEHAVTINDDNFFEQIRKTINDEKYNKFNQYQLRLMDPKETNSQQELTFFNSKLKEIFSYIKKIGMNKSFDAKNMYQFADSINVDFMTYKDLDKQYYNQILKEYKRKIYANRNVILKKLLNNNETEQKEYEELVNNIQTTAFSKFRAIANIKNNENDLDDLRKIADENQEDEIKIKINDFVLKKIEKGSVSVMYLSFSFNTSAIIENENINMQQKALFLSKNIAQSYSLTPRITTKTRNSNKQFFSQGNDNLLKEGTGDIIDFDLSEFNVQQFNALMVSNKNQKNIGFETLISSNFIKDIHENAAKYHSTYIDINGEIDKTKIAQNMAIIDINYQNQMDITASINILGEPYWSHTIFDIKMSFIYLNIYYASGNRSSHTGLYTVTNAVHSINNNKYTTRLDLKRIPTFLTNFSNFSIQKRVGVLYSQI